MPALSSTDVPAVIAVGRVSVDLYAQEVHASFTDPQTFRKSIGGSPTNVAVAAARHGHHAAVAAQVVSVLRQKLGPAQAGYVYTCEYHLLTLLEIAADRIARGLALLVLLGDLIGAFPKVWRALLVTLAARPGQLGGSSRYSREVVGAAGGAGGAPQAVLSVPSTQRNRSAPWPKGMLRVDM